MVEPTGAETIVVLRFGMEKMLGRVPPDVRLAVGVRAEFVIDPQDLPVRFRYRTADRVKRRKR